MTIDEHTTASMSEALRDLAKEMRSVAVSLPASVEKRRNRSNSISKKSGISSSFSVIVARDADRHKMH